MKNNNKIKFFWQIIKPYKWWYLLMIQAPIIGAFFNPVNHYVLKLIVDKISSNAEVNFALISTPIIIYITASLTLETVWRVANFADYKSQPYIEAKIIEYCYREVTNFNHQFFQDNLSGKIASKINGIRDSYIKIYDLFRFGLIWQSLGMLISLFLLFIVHKYLAIMVGMWLIIFLPVMFFSKRKCLTYSEQTTEQKQKITGLLNDLIANFANISIFAGKKAEFARLNNANKKFIIADQKRLKFLFINHFIMGFIYSGLSIGVLLLLVKLKQDNFITIGDFAMVFGLIFTIIESSWGFLNNIDELLIAFGTLKESFTIIAKEKISFDKPLAGNLII
jgi:ATP-binding cassette subfamily B protein